MAQLFYGSIPRADTRLHYYRTGGADKPPLLFLHGLVSNSFTWGRLPLSFMSEYDCIFLDFRGHGLTKLGSEPVSPDLLTEDVMALLTELDTGPVAVVGHSLGALVGMLLAGRVPSLVQSLVLLDPPLWQEERVWEEASVNAQIDAWEKMKDEDFSTYAERLIRQNPWMSEVQLMHFFKSMRQFKPELLHSLLAYRLTWTEIAAGVSCPVLLVAADEEPQHVPSASVQKLSTMWTDFQAVRIPESNHFLTLQHVRAIEPVIDKFLRRVRRQLA